MAAKKTTKTKLAAKKTTQVATPAVAKQSESPKKVSTWIFLIPVVIAILALLVWKNKNYIVVATVDNKPVWRWDMEKIFVDRYGQATLEEMITTQLFKNEASKKGIQVSDKDVDAKISELKKTLPPGLTIENALSQQGMTYEQFRKKVELQLLAEKLIAGNIFVSEQEITSYIEQNKDSLPATDEASLKAEVKDNLMSQKRTQELQKMFDTIKKNAKIQKYL